MFSEVFVGHHPCDVTCNHTISALAGERPGRTGISSFLQGVAHPSREFPKMGAHREGMPYESQEQRLNNLLCRKVTELHTRLSWSMWT
jgi:hypothetical protein